MRSIWGFFRVLLSFILTIAVAITGFAYGVVKPIVNNLTPERFSSIVASSVKNVVQEITTGDNTEVKKQIDNVLKENNIPVSSDQIIEIIKQPDVQEVISDYASSVILHSVDESKPIEHPSREEVTKVVVENKEDIIPIIMNDPNADAPSDLAVTLIVNAYYDEIIEALDNYITGGSGKPAHSMDEIMHGRVNGALNGILDNENNEEVKQEIATLMANQGIPITVDELFLMLQQPVVQTMASEYVSSVILNYMDRSVPIKYPSVSTMTTITVDNKELIFKAMAGGNPYVVPTDDEIRAMVPEHYDELMAICKQYTDAIVAEVL